MAAAGTPFAATCTQSLSEPLRTMPTGTGSSFDAMDAVTKKKRNTRIQLVPPMKNTAKPRTAAAATPDGVSIFFL